MGRHAAADGAGTDPIVAAALASLPDGAPGTRHSTADVTAGTTAVDTAVDTAGDGTEGGLGWPGDTTTGGGLGWPDTTDTAGGVPGDDAGTGDVLRETARMDAVPSVPGPRGASDEDPPTRGRGWRRIFGGTAA